MKRSISIDISDEVYLGLEELAPRLGMTAEEAAAHLLHEITPRRKPSASQEADDLAKLMSFAGTMDSGDRHSGDNERIDADLAREYARGL